MLCLFIMTSNKISYTLGICNDETASACLFNNGVLVAAASEERFSKVKNGLFVGNVNPPYYYNVEKAIFSTNKNVKKINLEISNNFEGKSILLLSKNFIFKNQSKEINLNLNLEKFGIRLGKLFIKVTEEENNLDHIEGITLKLISKYDLNNFKVLEKADNCYFLERLS